MNHSSSQLSISSSDTKFFFLLSLNILIAIWALFKFHDFQFNPQTNSSLVRLDPAEINKKYPIDLENATAVFNSVNGALKQKDANMNPVGLSFIPAYLPPNTLMYHSTLNAYLPDLFEWIAMDYEFSYNFAHFARGKFRERRPPPRGPNERGPNEQEGQNILNEPQKSQSLMDEPRKLPPGLPFSGSSYLYTLRNTKPLDKLIYLDGASAAKTTTGEMDQQLILSRQLDADARVLERLAAQKICEWGKLFGLQGIVRMEIGFEIILCDFFDNIEIVSNITLSNATQVGNLPNEPQFAKTELEKKRMQLMDLWELMAGYDWLAAGSRANEGEHRILLDFSGMVTPLNKTYIDRDPYKRRINHLAEAHKEDIIHLLEKFLVNPVDPFHKTNWQSVTETITDKFAPILIALNNTLLVFEIESQGDNLGSAIEDTVTNVTLTLFNFFRRYSDTDLDIWEEKKEKFLQAAVSDYIFHTFDLNTQLDILIYSSIYRTTVEILSFVRDLFFLARLAIPDFYVDPTEANYKRITKDILKQKELLDNLMRVLEWPLFARCSTMCGWDEVCYVPTWGPSPLGWGSNGNGKYLEYDGERYRIPLELSCVKLNDLVRY